MQNVNALMHVEISDFLLVSLALLVVACKITEVFFSGDTSAGNFSKSLHLLSISSHNASLILSERSLFFTLLITSSSKRRWTKSTGLLMLCCLVDILWSQPSDWPQELRNEPTALWGVHKMSSNNPKYIPKDHCTLVPEILCAQTLRLLYFTEIIVLFLI